ncbi:unnamed protein product [Rotaria sp. Silwood2]|nr:unnamed protein product [Rotaria sp. Silwood2]CAF2530539.1 unnamed protein product [Rotaria sp. Silwood2]CAF2765946.1 unnamed protein product [Rotaria sp. Silwood2]CAF3383109.1 unnamed protein product [Rotaria sp. Silwood2]CAF3954655.1 unnamed protein product [Rotaria sp. Silwood2]
MPTSVQTLATYIPRAILSFDENTINEAPRTVKDITTDVQQLVNVTSNFARAGLSTTAKTLIVTGVVIGAAIVIAAGVTLGIILSATTTTTTTAMAAPSNLFSYRANTGQSYVFVLTGSRSGSIWGTNIYTDDSNLATAAVHSGFVQYNQTSVVTVRILAAQSSYTSTTQNGVTSFAYGYWGGSYSFISATG